MPRGINRFDEAALQRILWTPRAELTLSGWWDASDFGTMSFGTGISAWRSKAGATNELTQATGSAQPTLNTSYRRGRPYAVFDGTQAVLIASPSGFPTGLNAITLASICYFNSTGSNSYAGGLGSATTGTARLINKSAGDLGRIAIFSATSILETVASAYQIDAILSGSIDTSSVAGSAANAVVSLNGVQKSGTLNANNISAGFALGRLYNYATGFFVGGLGEFMVFNDYITGYRLRRIEGYLAWKWNNVESLSADHPFKNRPPLIGD